MHTLTAHRDSKTAEWVRKQTGVAEIINAKKKKKKKLERAGDAITDAHFERRNEYEEG